MPARWHCTAKSSRDVPIREIMTSRVLCIEPAQTADQCMALMTDKRIRHLPVLEGAKVVGVVSIGDVVRAIVEEQQFTIRAARELHRQRRLSPVVAKTSDPSRLGTRRIVDA